MQTHSEFTYRPATHADIPAMAQIRASEWGNLDYWVSRITAYMEVTLQPGRTAASRIIYVSEDVGKVVGFIAGHLTDRFDCDGELQWINVVKEQRGAGIAAELVRCLAKWFVDNNANRICVDPDEPARPFYSKLGATELNKHWMVWEDVSRLLE